MRDFRFTEQQRALRSAVRDFLTHECTPADVRAAVATGEHSDHRWHGLAELGVVGATVPEEHGGLGLGFLDLVLPLEEAGHAALPEPLLEVTAIAAPLLAAAGQAGTDVLAELAAGRHRPVAVLETWQAHAPDADAVLVWDDDETLRLGAPVDPTGEHRTLDPTRRVAAVQATGPTLLSGPPAAAARRSAADRAAAGAAAMLVGLGSRMVELAVEHARQREQFGAPIGSFQAVKHLLADCVVQLELARPAVYRAAWSVHHRPDDAETSVHASVAKVLAGAAAEHTAKAALQVHGAIGYTSEHDLHLWMRRTWSLAASYGTTDEHRARLRTHVVGT